MMLDKTNCRLLTKAITKSIQEFIPSEQKLLLIDALYFITLVTEFTQVCSKSDVATISNLFDFCAKLNIDPSVYLSCAYSYIEKYHTKGRKLSLGYLMSDNVVAYVSSKLKVTVSSDALLSTQVRTDITNTEKQLRAYLRDNSCNYLDAFKVFYKLGRISDTFLLYKVYIGYEPLMQVNLSEPMQTLYDALEPIFIGLSAKYGQYSVMRASTWSNSKIESFDFCPLFFRDRYLKDDIPPKYLSNEASDSGSKAHLVFEEIVKRYNAAKKKDITAIYTRYMQSKHFAKLSGDIQEHLPGVHSFFTSTDSPLLLNLRADTKLYTEEKFEYAVDGLTITGIADLVIVNGNSAIVVDYKTSKIDNPFWLDKNNDKYHKQLSLYAGFVEAKFNVTVTKLVIVYTRGLIKEFDTVDSDILNSRLDDIGRIRLAIKLNNFKANNRSCKLCRHPACEFRTDLSMWDDTGKRRAKSN